MAYYATPTGNQTAGLYEIFRFINNSATQGYFWISMLFVIWITAFIALKQYSSSRAWTFASFMCAILSIFMAIIDYVAPTWMYLFIFLTLIGFVWLKLETE